MSDCLTEIDKIRPLEDHQVPQSESPMAGNLLESFNIKHFNIEYYNQYPLPWYALMYDASRFITTS